MSGVGVGYWFMKQGSKENNEPQVVEVVTDKYINQSIVSAYKDLEATKHIAEYESQVGSLTKLEGSTYAAMFIPTKQAVDDFVESTALGFVKFLPYHVAVSESPIEIKEGAKIKTDDGQELVVVVKQGDSYIRDAKGNDVRLRTPIATKNGPIYIIDKVLLTQ